jgi:hypothetical protein
VTGFSIKLSSIEQILLDQQIETSSKAATRPTIINYICETIVKKDEPIRFMGITLEYTANCAACARPKT